MNAVQLNDLQGLITLIRNTGKGQPLAFDIETTSTGYKGSGIAPAGSPYVRTALLQFSRDGITHLYQTYKSGIPVTLLAALYDFKGVLVGHNIWKYDILCLMRDGLVLDRMYRGERDTVFWDTLQVELILDSKKRGASAQDRKGSLSVSIKAVAQRRLGIEINKQVDHSWAGVLTQDQINYAANDVAYLLEIYHQQLAELKANEESRRGKAGLLSAAIFEMELCFAIAHMEYEGMPFSPEGMWKYNKNRLILLEQIQSTPAFQITETVETLHPSKVQHNEELAKIFQSYKLELTLLMAKGLPVNPDLLSVATKTALQQVKREGSVHSQEVQIVVATTLKKLAQLGSAPKLGKVSQVVTRPVNFGSPSEVRSLLHSWGYHVESSKASVLQTLYHVTGDERLQTLMLGRRCNNSKDEGEASGGDSEYGQKMLDSHCWHNSQGFMCLHGTFANLGTVTGRFASQSPNLQNRPRDSREMIFRAPAGYKWISCDYSAIEMLAAAVLSGDKAFLDYIAGTDVHKMAVSIALNIPIEEVTSDQRKKIGKFFNFSLIYGSGANSLQQKLQAVGVNLSLEEVKVMRERWLGMFEVLYARIRANWDIGTKIEKQGGKFEYYYPTGLSRVFDSYDLHKSLATGNLLDWANMLPDTGKKRASIGNKISNNTAQGLAAAGMKLAILRLYRKGVRCISTVHDELNVLCRTEDAETIAATVTDVMISSMTEVFRRAAVLPDKLPTVKVECSIADFWKH